MLDIAKHIVASKTAPFKPQKFEDRYEAALIDLIERKRGGKSITSVKSRSEVNVIDLMAALRASLSSQHSKPAKARVTKGKKRIAGQKEMLLPISGKGSGKNKIAAKPRSSISNRRVG